MQVVPTQPIPNQTFQVQLAGQACTIDLIQTQFAMFMNLSVDGAAIISGVLCENLNRIVRDLYLGFSGDFVFFDTQGAADPVYVLLGSRFVLVYLDAAELPAGQG